MICTFHLSRGDLPEALRSVQWLAVVCVAAATLAGSALGRRAARHLAVAILFAAVSLLVVVAVDIVPDVARDISQSGIPVWVPMLAATTTFVLSGFVARSGCACQTRDMRGRSTGLAVAAHRALEGSVLALSGSASVLLALIYHAGTEGFALTALLNDPSRRHGGLLVVACGSPVLGAIAVHFVALPEAAPPILSALVAGILLRSSLSAAHMGLTLRSRPLAIRHNQPHHSISERGVESIASTSR